MDDRTDHDDPVTGPEGAGQEIPLDGPREAGGARSRWPLVGVIGLAVVAVLVVALAGRAGDDGDGGSGADPGGEAPSAAWNRTWVVERIVEGGEDRPVVAAGTEPPTLTLTEADGVTFTGCNGGAGPARLDGDRLVVDEVSSTLMGCEGPDGQALMAQDAWLGEFLMAGPTVTVDADTLVLATDDAEVHLREAAAGASEPGAPAPPGGDAPAETEDGFWGGRWQVLGVDPVDPSLPAELADDEVADELFLDATTEGLVSFTGCNGGAGDASLDGDVLEVGPMMSTELACGGPDGEALMAYDRWMADLLTSGPTVDVDGDDLTLTGADATVRLVRVADDGVTSSPGGGFDDGGDPDAPVSDLPGSDQPGTDQPWSIEPTPPDAPGAGRSGSSGGGSPPSPGAAPGTDPG